jgi:hypothetical protein
MNEETNRLEEPASEVWGLWLGVLGPPLLCLTHLEVTYALVPKICPTGNTGLLRITSLCFLVLVLLSGISSWRHARPVARGDQSAVADPVAARIQFMGQLGLWITALFALVIVGQAIPTFIIDPCQD